MALVNFGLGGTTTPSPTPTPTPTPTPSPSLGGPWSVFYAHTVTVYRFKPGQDADGGARALYPDAAYLTDVACQVENGSSGRLYDQSRVIEGDDYTIFFASNLGFGINDKIVWVDNSGTTHDLIIDGFTDMHDGFLQGQCEVSCMERT